MPIMPHQSKSATPMTSTYSTLEQPINYTNPSANNVDHQTYVEFERMKSLCAAYEEKLVSLEKFVQELNEENQSILKSNSDLIDDTSRLTDQLAESYANNESINQTNRSLEAKVNQLLTGSRLDLLSNDELQSTVQSINHSVKLFEKELAFREFCKQFGIDQSILTDGTGQKFSLIDSHRKLQDQLIETQSINQSVNQSINEFREREKQWIIEKQSLLEEKSKLMKNVNQSANQSNAQSSELQSLKQSVLELERRCITSEDEARRLRQQNIELNDKMLGSVNNPSHSQPMLRAISQPRTPVHHEYNYSNSPATKPTYQASPRSIKQQNNSNINQNTEPNKPPVSQSRSHFNFQSAKASPHHSPAVSPRVAPKISPSHQASGRIPQVITSTQPRSINQHVNPPVNQSSNQAVPQSSSQQTSHQHTPADRSTRPHQRRSSTATSLESLMQSACYYTPMIGQPAHQSNAHQISNNQSNNQSINTTLPTALRDITAQHLQYIDHIPAPQNRLINQPIKQSAKLSTSPRMRVVQPPTKLKPPTPLPKSVTQPTNSQAGFSVRPAVSSHVQKPTAASANKRIMR